MNKQKLAIFMSFAVVTSCLSGSCIMKKAKAGVTDLPFKLTAPKNVSLNWLEGYDSPTTMNFSWSMENDQVTYMDKAYNEPEWAKSTLNELGYDELNISLDVDWAVDDNVNGWHHTTYWDYPYISQGFSNGNDENGNTTLGPWDTVGIWDYWQQNTNSAWILRGVDAADDNEDWTGGPNSKGLKNQLQEGQYEIKDMDGAKKVTIDYTKHTVYARARWCFVTIQTDGSRTAIFSDWSETAGYGKDVNPYKNPYSEKNIPRPDISNLQFSDQDFNDYPVVTYDLKVSDELSKNITDIIGHRGSFYIETYAKPYGAADWTALQGDREIKPGNIEIALAGLVNEDSTPITKETPIEFRARFVTDQYESESSECVTVISEWSNTLTINAELIPKPSEISNQTGDTEAYKYMTEVINNDNDIKNSTFGTLLARQNTVGQTSVSLKWEKVKGAAKYAVYGNKCGKNPYTGTFNTYQKLSEVTDHSAAFTQVNGQDIEPGTYYKFIVMAVTADNKILKSSKTIHIATAGGKYTNPKSLTVAKKANKGKLTLKKGKTFSLKPKAVNADKKKTVNNHRKIQYESANKKIATVSSAGKIKAVKKGSCAIYVFAQNGIYKKITVTVK